MWVIWQHEGIGRSGTPYINGRGRQGRGPSLWEGLWPQRIVGPAIGAFGCRWLVRLARCLASLPSSRKTVVSHSRILEIPRETRTSGPTGRGASSCRSRANSHWSHHFLGFFHPNSRTLKSSSHLQVARRISKQDGWNAF